MKNKNKPQTAKIDVFAIYPSSPNLLPQTYASAIASVKKSWNGINFDSWEDIDIPGKFIPLGILDKIDQSNFILADISKPNFNVTFEVGYAIARGIRVVPMINKALSPDVRHLDQLGIFDTVGYQKYTNSEDISTIVKKRNDFSPLHIQSLPIDKSAPLYILDSLHKTDASLRILSRVKKSRIRFRSFDPEEIPRLSTTEAYRNVQASIGIIVNLLSSNNADFRNNNLRAAFIAGLATGFEKELLMLQEGEDPIPIDYRDLVQVYRHPDEINPKIASFAPLIMERLQEQGEEVHPIPKKLLEKLNLGSPAAENEATSLQYYFLQTDEYNNARSGKARLAVGRKGSGKTALFYRLRDQIRTRRENIVLDLKPDGYQLKRFKDIILTHLKEGDREHASTAFWEYIFVVEICYKLLQKDKETHIRDHRIFDYYRNLTNRFEVSNLSQFEDFSERILNYVNKISDSFEENWKSRETSKPILLPSDISNLIYKHDIPNILKELYGYLAEKEEVWLLFDNIDKGWPTHGVEPADIVILRGILDASRKLQRLFEKEKIAFYSVVFLRNDVYENLVNATPDRGKQTRVSLDWTNTDLLQELLRKRLVHGVFDPETDFATAWGAICCSHVHGEDSFEYIAERSLMRPRNLLNLVTYAKSSAVNLGHDKIDQSDIERACGTYSVDLVNDIGLEIRDVMDQAEDIIYNFIGAQAQLTIKQVYGILATSPVDPIWHSKIIELLMWFAFLGLINTEKGEERHVFIYDVHYDMKKMRVMAKNFKVDDTFIVINKAFWPFLEIESD